MSVSKKCHAGITSLQLCNTVAAQNSHAIDGALTLSFGLQAQVNIPRSCNVKFVYKDINSKGKFENVLG